MSEMPRERFEELKEAFAVGALTEDERREVEDYLNLHPELRQEVEHLSSLAHVLALSPTEHKPSPELRENILEIVESEASEAHGGTPRESSWTNLREYVSLQRIALGAAAVLVVVLFAWNILLQGEIQGLQGEVQALQSELQQRETFAMQGSAEAGNARAEVVEVEGLQSVIVAQDLPRIPEDKVLQIWVIEDGTPQSAGTFSSGDETIAAPIRDSLNNAEAVAITIEPSGGSDQPTTEPLLQTSIPT
ncbi:MAG: anti-sigma factor domain-containing protein [Rubrobacteraceae bacterium]